MAQALGIDVGGSGIKAAPVDIGSGRLLDERHRIETPQPATAPAMVDVMVELAEGFRWSGPVGVGFPGVVQHGVVRTAANLDPSWLGVDLAGVLGERLGLPVGVVNDADAAGLAEMHFGAGRGADGVVVMVTLGTGIGTAIFAHGVLVPNTELGHLVIDGVDAEERASARAREEQDLSFRDWAPHLDAYLGELHRLLWPDRIVIGGGVSTKFDKFAPLLNVPAEVVPAAMGNLAGIVGAALAAPTAGA